MCKLLPHTSNFSLLDLLINLSDLHCDRSALTDLRPVPLCLLPPLLNCANRKLLVDLGVIINCSSDSNVCCQTVFFQFQQKNTNKQKIARVLRTNNSSLSESYHASLRDPPYLAYQI